MLKRLKRTTKESLIEKALLLLLYIGGANLFLFIKTSGVENLSFSFSPESEVHILSAHLRVSISGFLVGVMLLLYEKYFHPSITRNFSFNKKRIVWQVDVGLIIILPIALVFTVAAMIEDGYTFAKAIPYTINFLTSGLFISYFVYYYILSSLVSFLRRLHKTFGQHVFYNYLIGKYAQPNEEHRVFMFVDLNNSTALAEKLGHTKYSRMLNRCFNDIIAGLQGFKYDIYQFVGDEIVFTWLTKDDNNGKAIAMFEALKRQLNLFKDVNKYLFGEHPTFKAAVSCGPVTATLVGDKSKNVAYHGDVLNTAARTLGLCKQYNCDLLITHFYAKKITENPQKTFKKAAQLKLKGKSLTSTLYALKTNI